MHEESLQQLKDIIALSRGLFNSYDNAQPYGGIILSEVGMDQPIKMNLNMYRECILFSGEIGNGTLVIRYINEDTDLTDLIAIAHDLGAITSAKKEALLELV